MKMNNLLAHSKKAALILLLATSLGACKQKADEEYFLEEVSEFESNKLGAMVAFGLVGMGMYGLGFYAGRKTRGND